MMTLSHRMVTTMTSASFPGKAGVYLKGVFASPTLPKEPIVATVSRSQKSASWRPSAVLSAGSWLIALVIALAPILAGCEDSSAHGSSSASPTATTATTPVMIEVPDVVGMKGDAAAVALKEAGLTSSPSYTDADGEDSVWNSSDWSVTSQDPAAGERVPADQAITLTVNDDSAEAAASASASASAAAAEASASAEASEQAVQDEPAQPEEPAQRPQQDPKKSTSTYYANCTEAKAAGAAPMYEGDPGYRSGLDRDHDGIACDK